MEDSRLIAGVVEHGRSDLAAGVAIDAAGVDEEVARCIRGSSFPRIGHETVNDTPSRSISSVMRNANGSIAVPVSTRCRYRRNEGCARARAAVIARKVPAPGSDQPREFEPSALFGRL